MLVEIGVSTKLSEYTVLLVSFALYVHDSYPIWVEAQLPVGLTQIDPALGGLR